MDFSEAYTELQGTLASTREQLALRELEIEKLQGMLEGATQLLNEEARKVKECSEIFYGMPDEFRRVCGIPV